MSWVWPLPNAKKVFPDAICQFGAIRRHDIHAGVDLFCELGQEVVAVEDGEVIGIECFTGPNSKPRKTPWWNETFAVLVKGKTGVVLYGEVQPAVSIGDRVIAGQKIASVDTPVLKHFKGRPMVMLHFELYTHDTIESVLWGEEPTPIEERQRPANLLDPTLHLLSAAGDEVIRFDISKYDGKSFRDPNADTKPGRWWSMWGGNP